MSEVIISKRQSMTITLGFIVGTAPLFVPTRVAALAGPDGWLSVIIAVIIGLLVVWIDTHLGGLYPEKTLVETIVLLLGKWVGGFIAVCLIFTALHTGTQVIWYLGDFFTTVFMPDFPPSSVNALFIVIIAVVSCMVWSFFKVDEIFIFLFSTFHFCHAHAFSPYKGRPSVTGT